MAPALIGKLLCRRIIENIDGIPTEKIVRLRITETECYFGEEDTACHASKGKTERTKVMYEEGGIAYIYLCYGIHSLINVVTGEKDHPEAVLIRGVEGYNGPGKLTKAMSINCDLNGTDLCTSECIWIEDDEFSAEYQTGKRIGIDYATDEYKTKHWRFTATNLI